MARNRNNHNHNRDKDHPDVRPQPDGTFVVVDPDGPYFKTFTTRREANRAAKAGERRRKRAAAKAPGPDATTTPHSPTTTPIPVATKPIPVATKPIPVATKPHPDAFEVADFGQGAGFGVTDESGGLTPDFFPTRDEARATAEARQRAFDAARAAANRPPPAPRPIPVPRPSTGSGGLGNFQPFVPRSSSADVAAAFASYAYSQPGSSGVPPTPTPSPFPTPATPGAGTSSRAAQAAWASFQRWSRSAQGAASAFANVPKSMANALPNRDSISNAFSRAFDASIGKAIHGAEKIVAASFAAFKHGFSRASSFGASAANAASWFGSTASKATMAAAVAAAFATMRARSALASASGFAGRGIASGFDAAKLGISKTAMAAAVAAAFATAKVKAAIASASGFAWKAAHAGLGAARAGFGAASRAARYANARARAAFTSVAGFAGRTGRAGFARARAGFARARAGLSRFGSGFGSAATAGLASLAKFAASMGEFGPAISAAVLAFRQVDHFAENQLDKNRRLLPYSAHAQMGFAGLAMGDQQRGLAMGRANGETTLELARQVNQLRNGLAGFDRLGMGVGNRLAITGAAAVNPAFREMGKIADELSKWMNKGDPKGDAMAKFVYDIQDSWAGMAGGLMGLLPGGAGFKAGMDDAIKEAKRERDLAARLETDAWAKFMSAPVTFALPTPAKPLKP